MRAGVVAIVAVLFLAFGWVAFAGEYPVFGPKRFERGSGQPAAESVTFPSPVSGPGFTLKVRNGDEQGKGRVSSAALTLNGAAILGPADFNQQVGAIERDVSFNSTNQLSVELNGQPGSGVTITITGKDDEPLLVRINQPPHGMTTEAATVEVSGTVVGEPPVFVNVNGTPATVTGQTFQVAGIPLRFGENLIRAIATDPGGNTASHSITVIRREAAPPAEPQPPGSFGAQYEDLIASDATKTSYDPKRFSLITGEVKDLGNNPIAGVTVSVNATSCLQCHGLEYGSVKTDANGRFTIPVEGGSTMTVVYQKDGLITSHRQVYVPWNDYAIAETIQMLPEDTAATTLTFDGNPHTVVTHRSTLVPDEFGTRSATMVFTGDNKAYEVDASGAVIRELKTITTRATEFVTPESMPANLPPTSAYTYCAELSVDGAERVKFAKPVTLWVDNFLGFDVGEIVPVGYYDRDRGVWIPSDNGVVVRLLDINGDGIVDALDATGDGLPDDLNGDGDYLDEVKGLNDPLRYVPGATFWRTSVTHFTPWDCNWPYGPPEDAIAPNPDGEPEVDQQLDENEECNSSINSFVEDRSRVFHEDIPIPGTDLTLHYASNRVNGYRTIGHRIRISVPASGEIIPQSLKRIEVYVQVAGRVFKQIFSPLPNQRAEFIWDGLDQLGRELSGTTKAQIRIGFVYTAIYYSGSELFDRAFANVGTNVTGLRGRREVTSWRRMEKTVDTGAIGLDSFPKGWSLSEHHYLSLKDTGTLSPRVRIDVASP